MTAESRSRRLALAHPPRAGVPELAEAEFHHARNVLRLQPGDAVLGLDGVGGAWPLRVTSVGRRDLSLELAGEPRCVPAPGTPGGGPHLEVALSLPRGGRAEEVVDRLTQLGVDRIRALVCEHSPPHARELSAGRRQRIERAAREACKQSIRLWQPEVVGPTPFADLWRDSAVPTAILDPRATRPLAAWVAAVPEPARVRLVVGPEGGLTPLELAAAEEARAAPTWLAEHVLRVETAAELACGLVHHFLRAPAR